MSSPIVPEFAGVPIDASSAEEFQDKFFRLWASEHAMSMRALAMELESGAPWLDMMMLPQPKRYRLNDALTEYVPILWDVPGRLIPSHSQSTAELLERWERNLDFAFGCDRTIERLARRPPPIEGASSVQEEQAVLLIACR